MKLYKIHKTVVLGIIRKGEQQDVLIDPDEDMRLGFDGKDIYYMRKTYTTNNAIDAWVADGLISEVSET